MADNKIVANEATESKFSWGGALLGFVIGAVLFYITIQIVSVLMFSRTAA